VQGSSAVCRFSTVHSPLHSCSLATQTWCRHQVPSTCCSHSLPAHAAMHQRHLSLGWCQMSSRRGCHQIAGCRQPADNHLDAYPARRAKVHCLYISSDGSHGMRLQAQQELVRTLCMHALQRYCQFRAGAESVWTTSTMLLQTPSQPLWLQPYDQQFRCFGL